MKIATKLPDEIRVMVKEISDNKEPYCDHYGRVTYFYIMLGATEILPIYQPGSVMFETAVKRDSEIAIFSETDQQNSSILSNHGAIFLTKFIAKLV